jgi:hypothetical protein
MTSFIQSQIPETMHIAVGIKPFREAPNILPRSTIATKTPMHKPEALVSNAANIGS